MEAIGIPTLLEGERERLEGRSDFLGRQLLRYGLDRATYFREIAPEATMTRRAG